MAKLKATPKSFAEAIAVLSGKDECRLGNNTYLHVVKFAQTGPSALYGIECIAVRLHNTDIVKFYSDGSTVLYSGGYRTVTTKERINHFIKGRIFQEKGQWKVVPTLDVFGYLATNTPLDFNEGFTFYTSNSWHDGKAIMYGADDTRLECAPCDTGRRYKAGTENEVWYTAMSR